VWGGEWKKAKTHGSGQGQFNRTANEANSNNNNTDKENTQNKQQNAQSNSHRLVPRVLPSRDSLPPTSSPTGTQHGGTWY